MQFYPRFRIIIADSSEIFRCGYRQIIKTPGTSNFEIIAEAAEGIELLEKVKKLTPDLVITDCKIPMAGGLNVCKIIQEKYPKIKLIALSLSEDLHLLMEMIAIDNGNGFIVKQANKVEVIQALETVMNGSSYYCSTVRKHFIAILKRNEFKQKKIQFSIQEMKVIRLICMQLTTKEIANNLKLGNRAIETYKHNIQEKIGARNVIGIVVYALINNIVAYPDLL